MAALLVDPFRGVLGGQPIAVDASIGSLPYPSLRDADTLLRGGHVPGQAIGDWRGRVFGGR